VVSSRCAIGAGLSAALPGVVAAHTDLPVIGVPLTSKTSIAGGLDALLSISQMPPGVPVACVGVDNARNAAAALEAMQAQLSLLATTADVAEGVAAFFQKREPHWQGR